MKTCLECERPYERVRTVCKVCKKCIKCCLCRDPEYYDATVKEKEEVLDTT